MGKGKNNKHRPFAGLTWAQLRVVRDAAHGHRGHNYGATQRAAYGMERARVPLVAWHNRQRVHSLTSTGQDVWLAVQQWRPDLYKPKA